MAEHLSERCVPVALSDSREKLTSQMLSARIGELEGVFAQIGTECDPHIADRAKDGLDQVKKRMALGGGCTLAALAGGTGSGKSTLFNALTGFDFADAGRLRPTTQQPTACTWQAQAEDLLDYLEVKKERRIERGSALTPVSEELRGLVLLDLPDHDSVRRTNCAFVSRLMPLTDLLIWVVDPQKYADQILHRDFLGALRERGRSMAVILNQTDTVAPESVDLLVSDLRRLLAEDGLEDVPVFPVSALCGKGLEPVRELLKTAVGRTETVLAGAASQIDGVTRLLASGLGSREVRTPKESKEKLTADISAACGVPAVADAIRGSGRHLSAVAPAPPQQPASAVVRALREAWITDEVRDLPPLWARAVRKNTVPADRLRRRIGAALEAVPVPHKNVKAVFAVLFLACAAVVACAAAEFLCRDLMRTWQKTALFAGTAVFLLCLWAAAAAVGRVRARRRAVRYERQVLAELEKTVDECLLVKADEVLERYGRVRALLLRKNPA